MLTGEQCCPAAAPPSPARSSYHDRPAMTLERGPDAGSRRRTGVIGSHAQRRRRGRRKGSRSPSSHHASPGSTAPELVDVVIAVVSTLVPPRPLARTSQLGRPGVPAASTTIACVEGRRFNLHVWPAASHHWRRARHNQRTSRQWICFDDIARHEGHGAASVAGRADRGGAHGRPRAPELRENSPASGSGPRSLDATPRTGVDRERALRQRNFGSAGTDTSPRRFDHESTVLPPGLMSPYWFVIFFGLVRPSIVAM
jgi:hypothetical protein